MGSLQFFVRIGAAIRSARSLLLAPLVCTVACATSLNLGFAPRTSAPRGSAQGSSAPGDSTPRATANDSHAKQVVELTTRADVDNAKALFKRAMAEADQANGSRSLAWSVPASHLAFLDLQLGDYPEATTLAAKALNIGTRVLGNDSQDLAEGLLLWGQVLAATGRCSETEVFFHDAEIKFTARYGEGSLQVAEVRREQAKCLMSAKKYPEAFGLLKRALSTQERLLGHDDLQVVITLTVIGELFRTTMVYPKAEDILVHAMDVLRRTGRIESLAMADVMEQLGLTYLIWKADLVRGEKLLQGALAIREKKLDPGSPRLESVFATLVELYWAAGDLKKSAEVLDRCITVGDRVAENRFNARVPEFDYGGVIEHDYQKSYAISLQALSPNDVAMRRIALRALLDRKGQLTEMMGSQVRSMRTKLGASSLDGYLSTRRTQSELSLESLVNGSSPALDSQETAARDNADKLVKESLGAQADVTDLQATNRVHLPEVKLEEVVAAIPAGTALVEFAQYTPVDLRSTPPKKGALSYAAFVVWGDGRVEYVALGEAAGIDDLSRQLRSTLSSPDKDFAPSAKALYARLLAPIVARTGATNHLLLATDGPLASTAFGALIDAHGDFAIKHLTFTYLTTGRQLFTLAHAQRGGATGAKVIADPDYGAAANSASASGSPSSGLARLRRLNASRLLGTKQEGSTISEMLGTKMLTGEQATRVAVGSVTSPRVLHIATHGFFMDADEETAENRAARGLALDTPGSPSDLRGLDPLLRAGLILAGANQHRAGDLGILTAEEVMWMKLSGTELVVLSACETGVGHSFAGQGLYGLGMAFTMAGARSLVMSLWKVDDDATRDLMVAFYRALAKGSSRADALRTAQLALLTNRARVHPYYWAGFLQYGDGTPMPG